MLVKSTAPIETALRHSAPRMDAFPAWRSTFVRLLANMVLQTHSEIAPCLLTGPSEGYGPIICAAMHFCTFASRHYGRCLRTPRAAKRQYALRERAVSLGWPIERIHTIDSDLGHVGRTVPRTATASSIWFREVALGHAGIILGLEVVTFGAQ